MRVVCWIVDGTCRIDKNCLLETSISTVSVIESNLDLQNSVWASLATLNAAMYRG